jgi:probable addiction module antidote protein
MTRSYSEWRLEKLSDPRRAARYLNAAKKDSKEAFLHALKNVIQANQVAKVAREAGVSRESVYRSFSAEGNPTFDTLSAILEAVDIDFSFSPIVHAASESQSGPLTVGGAIEAKTLNGNVPKLSFMGAGAVAYFLPANVLGTSVDVNPINCQQGAAPWIVVNIQDNLSAAVQGTIQTSGSMVRWGTIDQSQNTMINVDCLKPLSRSTGSVRECVNA